MIGRLVRWIHTPRLVAAELCSDRVRELNSSELVRSSSQQAAAEGFELLGYAQARSRASSYAAAVKFHAFLSHYKAEAGSDARFMHDLMQRMLGHPPFLD